MKTEQEKIDYMLSLLKTDENLEVLSAYLNTMTVLDVHWSQLNFDAVVRLANILAKNTTLQRLDLFDNNIGSEGAQHLVAALEKNTTLAMLGLAGNNLGPEDARYLAAVLEKNTTLKSLDLWHNNLGSQGVQYLSLALAKNTTLQNLDLINNKIGSQGIQYLGAALKENTALKSLDLSHNDLNFEDVLYIANIIKSMTTRFVGALVIKVEIHQNLLTEAFQYHTQYIRNRIQVLGEVLVKKPGLPDECALKIKDYLVDDTKDPALEAAWNVILSGQIKTNQNILSKNNSAGSILNSSLSVNSLIQRKLDVLQSKDECKTASICLDQPCQLSVKRKRL